MLKVENICISFDDKLVLDDLSINVCAGEVLAVAGPSGSGKSTLLRVIAGLLIPNSGIIRINDLDITSVPTHKRNVGMVFQDNQLFPHMNVERNIGYGLRTRNIDKLTREARIAEMLNLVGLSGFTKRKVDELSGGEAKRVALARSLAPSPSVLLLDEPLTGLDKELHDKLMIELSELLRKTKTTAILVTHDMFEAKTIADRVFSLDLSS